MLHQAPTYRSALSLFRGLLEYGNNSFRSFSLRLQNILIFIHLEFDAVCNNLFWVQIISEGVSVYNFIFTRYFLNSNTLSSFFFFKFHKNFVKEQVQKNKNELSIFFLPIVRSMEFLLYAGNALDRVQRVHEPADLWDITFCTR